MLSVNVSATLLRTIHDHMPSERGVGPLMMLTVGGK
jgi:hypothetical protein